LFPVVKFLLVVAAVAEPAAVKVVLVVLPR
jgi:hypothetical protein